MIIYKITNIINGKVYIGKTVHSLKQRWSEHCCDAFRLFYWNKRLYLAMRDYGLDNFIIEELCKFKTSEWLNSAEKWFIKKLKANDWRYGYNATPGGDGMPAGIHPSDEIRYKISIKLRGRQKSAEHLLHLSQALIGRIGGMTGKHQSKNARWKQSIAATGRHHSEETKQKLSNLNKGKPGTFKGHFHSEETKQKIRKSRLGTHLSEETKRKMSITNTGVLRGPMSEKQKQKDRESHLGKKHSEESKLYMSMVFKGRKYPNRKSSAGYKWKRNRKETKL